MLLPDLSALLSLKQPLKPEVASLARRPVSDGQLGGISSRLNGYCNNGWKRRRYRRGQGQPAAENRFDCAPTENGLSGLVFPKADDATKPQCIAALKTDRQTDGQTTL